MSQSCPQVVEDLGPIRDAREAGQRRAAVPGAVEEEDREGEGEQGLGGPALVLDEGVEAEGGRCLATEESALGATGGGR